MRLMFVHYVVADRGSAQDMHNYVHAARSLGHDVILYGPENVEPIFNYSLDIESVDAVIFIFEWTNDLQYGDNLDFVRILDKVPRQRRIVIDCDGRYNDAISVAGDRNHPDLEASRQWIAVCDSLSDRIFQPTYHPFRSNVRPFFFHAYDPGWEVPLDFTDKQFGMVYVGNNWFRWRPLYRVLKAIEAVREEVGPVQLVGHGWDQDAPWASPSVPMDAYYTDPDYLKSLDVEVMPPIRFDQVVNRMGRGVCSPIIYRPLFDHLQLVTCRTFETLAANTIPLFAQTEEFVEEIYGERALELVLGNDASDKILDVLRRPEHYAEVVGKIRSELARRYSYTARIKELVEIFLLGK